MNYLDQVQLPAANHAELVKAFARKFIASQRGEFTAEDIADAYKALGNPIPKEGRTWGIMRVLKDEGLIYSTGITVARSKSRNGGYLAKWRRSPQFEQFEAKEIIGKQARLF